MRACIRARLDTRARMPIASGGLRFFSRKELFIRRCSVRRIPYSKVFDTSCVGPVIIDRLGEVKDFS